MQCEESIELRHVMQAGLLVETGFPPFHTDSVRRIVVALNLLNAAVKQPWGRRVVSYRYIKGMVAHLFLHLLLHPVDNVSLYWDYHDDIVYIRIGKLQMSFHHVPFTTSVKLLILRARLPRQKWDGVQHQQEAVRLLKHYCGELTVADEQRAQSIMPLLLHKPSWHYSKQSAELVKKQKQCHRTSSAPAVNNPSRQIDLCQNPMRRLYQALTFNIYQCNSFQLYRRCDNRPVRIVRYTGDNYDSLLLQLAGHSTRIQRRRPSSLVVGKLYYVTPRLKIRALSPSQYLKCMAQHAYLRQSSGYSSLCVTYAIALYITKNYHSVRFISTLNYHALERRRLYSYKNLLALAPHSPSRRLKVWIAVDIQRELCNFRLRELSPLLLEDYRHSPDYYREFVVTWDNGFCGILAYRRHVLLPPVYNQVSLHTFHANVQNVRGKWALYSLLGRCFLTGFNYDSIWYDNKLLAICGSIGEKKVVIRRVSRR